MQGPVRDISGSLGRSGPQPVDVVGGLLTTIVAQNVQLLAMNTRLLQMLLPASELAELQLAEKVAVLDNREPTEGNDEPISTNRTR